MYEKNSRLSSRKPFWIQFKSCLVQDIQMEYEKLLSSKGVSKLRSACSFQ